MIFYYLCKEREESSDKIYTEIYGVAVYLYSSLDDCMHGLIMTVGTSGELEFLNVNRLSEDALKNPRLNNFRLYKFLER